MTSRSFDPSPIDTSNIALPAELNELVELLAENTHNVWARQRLSDGWRYASKRDDVEKRDPSLVSYEQLPEREKQYDRNTAIESLKVILKLGYSFAVPNPATAALQGTIPPPSRPELLEEINELNLPGIIGLWHGHSPDDWNKSPEVYRTIGQRVLKLGEPLLGYDILNEGLKSFPADKRLRQLLALALARSGAPARANALLRQLREEGHRDEETLGILARTHKDLWAQAADSTERHQHLQLAHKFYNEAYETNRGYYAGINAATLGLLLGKEAEAQALAQEVRYSCLQEFDLLPRDDPRCYWPLATLGEAALILRRWSEAEERYSQAAELGRGQYAELSSTRRNARLIQDYLGRDLKRIEECFKIPSVVVFSGHMIDGRDRAAARFPHELEPAVREALRVRLRKLDVGLGYASAACGSDILFLEALLETDGELHIVLPYNEEQFVRDSVAIVPWGDWSERFQRVLASATEVITASDQKLEEGSTSYEYANLLLHGLANIKARQLETKMVPLAVWDRQAADGSGGTASAIEQWQSVGLDVEVIDIGRIRRETIPQLTSAVNATTKRVKPDALSIRMMAMLFADAVNFSKLAEDQIPRFLEHFLGTIGNLVTTSEYGPVTKNTWGDGLYFVFSTVRDAGQFSLELCELMSRTDWAATGLPKDLSLRIALHAGPVYSVVDPIINQPTFTGTHVSRAARMEPITPPGQVYASQAFAALAAAQNVTEFTCDYVGQTPLAKGYGTFPTYHVRAARRS
jgi:class 3 adenylate cyclase